MNRSRRIPLAWKNLTHNRVRMTLFSAGIGFAVVLMFIQLGCQNALLDSSALLLDRLRAEMIMVPRQQTTLLVRNLFPRQVLARAGAVKGVAEVHPLYLEYASSFLRDTHAEEEDRAPSRNIRVIGIDPRAHLIDLPQLDPNGPRSCVKELQLPGRALFDQKSKRGPRRGQSSYGPIEVGTRTDLSGTRVVIVGLVEIGSDFGTDGTIIVSEETFARSLRNSPYLPSMDEIDLGLVRLTPGADRGRVQEEIRDLVAGDEVEVLTREEFVTREKRFWQKNTPIGYVFGFGVGMGFLVGLVICYQILSSDIRDNLPAYATLRAIGYSNRFLMGVVLEEAMLLAALGFLPGLLFSWGVFEALGYASSLPMRMTPGRIGFVLFLTVVMCAGSGLLAVRQAQQADPAEVF